MAKSGDCLLCPKAPPSVAKALHATAPRGQSGLSPLFAPSAQLDGLVPYFRGSDLARSLYYC